jgi:hypothetical protein
MCLFGVKLTQDKAIHFEDLEFIADRSDNLSLSPEGGDSSAVVGGMTYNGSPSLHAILKESPSEDELRLPFPEGMQHGDVCHPHRDYAVTGGDPNASDHTGEATTDCYIDYNTHFLDDKVLPSSKCIRLHFRKFSLRKRFSQFKSA